MRSATEESGSLRGKRALVTGASRGTEKHQLALNPQGRIGVVTEVADLAAFLVSSAGGYITGVTIPIDGGELLTAGSEPGR